MRSTINWIWNGNNIWIVASLGADKDSKGWKRLQKKLSIVFWLIILISLKVKKQFCNNWSNKSRI